MKTKKHGVYFHANIRPGNRLSILNKAADKASKSLGVARLSAQFTQTIINAYKKMIRNKSMVMQMHFGKLTISYIPYKVQE